MKAQFLKLAKCKDEKSFYKKYPNQEAFLKAHPEAKELIKKAQGGMNLDNNNVPDYMNVTPYGPQAPFTPPSQNYEIPSTIPQGLPQGYGMSMNDYIGQNNNSVTESTAQPDSSSGTSGINGQQMAGSIDAFGKAAKAYSAEKKQAQKAKQNYALTKLNERLSLSDDVNTIHQKHIKDRPEDYIQDTDRFYKSQGNGSGVLQSGGEISNNYSPNTLYDDLGYVPHISDNVKQYQSGGNANGFIQGQFDNNAGSQLGNAIPIPGVSQIVSMVGGMADNMFGPAGDIKSLNKLSQQSMNRTIGNSLWKNMGAFNSVRQEGGYVSNDWTPQVIAKFGDHTAKDYYNYSHEYDTLRSGGHLKDDEYIPVNNRGLQTYQTGGELKTHWGGNVEPVSYNPFSEGEGYTYNAEGNSHTQSDHKGRTGIGLEVLQDGGEFNPKNLDLPLSPIEGFAEGIGKNPSQAHVEIEQHEPISMTKDGAVVYGNLKTNNKGLETFNLPKDFNGMKFKHIVNNVIAPKENKLNNQLQKILSNINSENNDSLSNKTKEIQHQGIMSQLKSLAEQKKNLSDYQEAIHNTTDYISQALGKNISQEKYAKNGEISHILAKGELPKNAKNGKTIKAQDGTYAVKGTLPGSIDYNTPDTAGDIFKGSNYETQWGLKRDKAFSDPTIAKKLISDLENYSGQDAEDVKAVLNKEKTMSGKIAKAYELASDKKVGPYHTILNSIIDKNATPTASPAVKTPEPVDYSSLEQTPNKFPWGAVANSALGMFKKPFNMPLDPEQIAGEMYGLASNQYEAPWGSHAYSMLETPSSYRDPNRDAIMSMGRAAIANSANNPAAQSAIFAQIADKLGETSARELGINQQTQQGIYNNNVNTVNHDIFANLGNDINLSDKISQAKSRTKDNTIAALESISAKKLQNKEANYRANIDQATHPDYSFNSFGQLIKNPRFIDFNVDGKTTSSNKKAIAPDGFKFTYNDDGTVADMKKLSAAREGKSITPKRNVNGSIVKAFKSL